VLGLAVPQKIFYTGGGSGAAIFSSRGDRLLSGVLKMMAMTAQYQMQGTVMGLTLPAVSCRP